jgi:hypothetical protein
MMNNTLLIVLISAPFVIAALFFLYKYLLQLTTKPVLEISLVSNDNPRWLNKKKIAELVDTFQKYGFELTGHYDCPEMPGIKIAGFVKPSEQLIAVIYDHPIAGIWEDICVEYNDGESLTVSNAPMGQEMDHMPGSTKVYMKGSSLEELLSKVIAERKNKARKTITKEEFSSNFEQAYKKEMKWRMERGGPTVLEVKKVADETGIPLNSETMQEKTQQLHKIWMKEKDKPKKIKKKMIQAELPSEYQRPELFRQVMEQKSDPMPEKLNIHVIPAYIVLMAAIGYWLYFGFQYNKVHTVSLTAVVIFLAVFLFLFIILIWINIRHQSVKMCPFLKQIADMRPGAFLFISGTFPTLFYARERWIGKLVFWMGGDNTPGTTSLEATTTRSGGWLSISQKSLIGKIFGRSDKDSIPLPDSDFSRKFTMSGSDKVLAQELLGANIAGIIVRLEKFKKPLIDIDGKTVVVKIDGDLSSPRKEADLKLFLEVAENIVDTVVRHE